MPGAHTEHCMRSPNRVPGDVRLGCLFLMPASLRFGSFAHVLSMRKGSGYVVSYSGQHCASMVLKRKLHKKSPLRPPIHAQISADSSAAQRSKVQRPGVSMVNYTLTDLLLFSAGAILVNLLYVCIKNSDCMSLDASDSRCHGRSFSMEKIKRTDDPESVRQWLSQSWVSVCFSKRLFLKARMHH